VQPPIQQPSQQPVQQPVQQPSQQPMQQPQTKKKKPAGMIIGITAAVVAICVGGFFGMKALNEKDDPLSGTDVSPSVSPSVSDGIDSPAIPEETPDAYDDVATLTITDEAPESQLQNSFEDYVGFANGDEASIGDFFWFTENVKWDGLPADRTAITDFNAIAGYWKAHTETIPMSPDEGEYWKWFNAEISGNADQAIFTFHTKGFTAYDQETGRVDDISTDDGVYLNGNFTGGRLVAGDIDAKGMEINIQDFYIRGDKQYAVGEISYISGEKEYIALVRP